uniref:Ig-like domain-containing protein n=1 Tax=Glossina palpalis gambiensis TaxID=67801 RepID=A0A1B0BUX3_9MUSC
MLTIPHQLVGAPEGFNVTIECLTEAHPTSLNYWTRGEGPIIHDSGKFKVESSIGVPVYKTHMKLTIINVSSSDDGIYKCVAKNPRGETDGIIRLYDFKSQINEITLSEQKSLVDKTNDNESDDIFGKPDHNKEILNDCWRLKPNLIALSILSMTLDLIYLLLN